MAKKRPQNKLHYIPSAIAVVMVLVLSSHILGVYQEKAVLGERIVAQAQKGGKGDVRAGENQGRNIEKNRISVEELENNETLQSRIRNEKLEIKREGNKVITSLEEENKVVDEIESDEVLDEINEELEEHDVTISTSAGGLSIQKGKVKAKTGFPLSINPVTGELTVTTPAGSKIVTVLPDSAVQNLLRHKKITVLDTDVDITPTPSEEPEDPVATDSPQLDDETSTESGELATTEIELTTLDSEPVFKVWGVTKKKILGLMPYEFKKTAYVSAETGDVVKVEQTFFSQMIEFLSF